MKEFLFFMFIIPLSFMTLKAQTTRNFSVNFTLPEVALIDIANGLGNINLTLSTVEEAGSAPQLVNENHSIWINFTSAVSIGTSRKIQCQLTGTQPGGLEIKILPYTYAGSGSCLGCSVSGLTTLGSGPTTLINNISGAYTGRGLNTGFRMDYNLNINNFADLRQGNYSLTALYTIMDN